MAGNCVLEHYSEPQVTDSDIEISGQWVVRKASKHNHIHAIFSKNVTSDFDKSALQ